MPITYEWDNPEQTILLETFEGRWTLEEYHTLVDAAADMLNSVEGYVHVIADFSQSRSSPKNIMSGARYAEKRLPRNQGVVVFVQPNVIFQAFIRVAQQLNFRAARHLLLADDLDEARQMIAEHAPLLPALELSGD